MLIQGSILSYLYSRLVTQERSIRHAVRFGWLTGGFLVSLNRLGGAAKYVVPAIGSWIAVEVIAGFAQFTLYGLLLGFVYRIPGPATVTRGNGSHFRLIGRDVNEHSYEHSAGCREMLSPFFATVD